MRNEQLIKDEKEAIRQKLLKKKRSRVSISVKAAEKLRSKKEQKLTKTKFYITDSKVEIFDALKFYIKDATVNRREFVKASARAFAYQKQVTNLKRQVKKLKRQVERVKEEKPKNVIVKNIIQQEPVQKVRVYQRLHLTQTDLLQILYISDTVYEALSRLGMSVNKNCFLHAAAIIEAKKRAVMTTDIFGKAIGAYSKQYERKVEAGKVLAGAANKGLLKRMGLSSGRQRFFITEEGRKYAKIVLNAVNLVLTRNWRDPDYEIKEPEQ